MTNRECERELLTLLDAAWRVFKECHPDGCHLDMFSTEDGHCVMGYKPGEGRMVRVIDGYLSPSGDYRFSR